MAPWPPAFSLRGLVLAAAALVVPGVREGAARRPWQSAAPLALRPAAWDLRRGLAARSAGDHELDPTAAAAAEGGDGAGAGAEVPGSLAEQYRVSRAAIPPEAPHLSAVLPWAGRVHLVVEHTFPPGADGLVVQAKFLGCDGDAPLGPVAIKMVSCCTEWQSHSHFRQEIRREVALMQAMSQTHGIVRYLGHWIEPPPYTHRAYIAMQLASKDVFSLLVESGESGRPLRVGDFVRDVTTAIVRMHRQGYAHRDVKLENMLAIRDPARGYRVVLSDFGAMCTVNKSGPVEAPCESMRTGTVAYWPPEVYREGFEAFRTWAFAMDVWAAGISLCELIARSTFFPFVGQEDDIVNLVKIPELANTKLVGDTVLRDSALCVKAGVKEHVGVLLSIMLDPIPERRLERFYAWYAEQEDGASATGGDQFSDEPMLRNVTRCLREEGADSPGWLRLLAGTLLEWLWW